MKYNLGYSYERIAKATKFSMSTIHAALQRFLQQGRKLTDRRKNNGRKTTVKHKLTKDAKEFLLD